MPQNLLLIQNSKVLFKGNHAFENLNFSLNQNENWAIIAESGWLQTAFLETIRGNTVIPEGHVERPFASTYIQEKSAQKEMHSFRDLIAYVSQKYEFRNKFNQQNFYFQQRFNSSESGETLTVEEYLQAIESKIPGPWTVSGVMDLLDLKRLKEESLLKLSNGETRRLAIASGLLRQPKLFLMDHPTTGLDVASRINFGKVLKEIISQGVHVILTCAAGEVPEGITDVALLNSQGVEKTFSSTSFSDQQEVIVKKEWKWDLLISLLSNGDLPVVSPVRLEKVTITYDHKPILNQVNWEVKAGEKWQLKGPNGSGKSTLISLLIGENPQAYSQNFWLFGRKRGTGESIWDVKRPTGFVAPELARFFPANQTVRKVILSGLFDTMGLFKKVNTEQDELADKWIELFELEREANQLLSRVSMEKQRWALLARAMIKKPQLLILDEASQGMDEIQRTLFKDTVQKICENSAISLIYVSHYDEDVPDEVNQKFSLVN
ncbi:ATP-binding cassette domain-containing protein [Algoriphagus sp. PAP.12]|uniref:ATP-binding cassette domain-containing protein n=1 Tax=Algoriphagus sp. PAP.12 TaxID=2996678 RepID=UPI00227B77BE|nr:ATP-binding cassette domain-containing protein [Algoriphagus sp. PAP.12]